MMMMMMMVMMMTMMMMMKSDAQTAADVQTVWAVRGGAALLTCDRLGGGWVQSSWDVRWTQQQQRVSLSLRNNRTSCDHGRCQLQSNGSLSFSHVWNQDAGSYIIEVFDEGGTNMLKKTFLLHVHDSRTIPLSVCCIVFLLLIFITFIILRKRRSQGRRAAGPREENVYMVMRSHHGNHEKKEECDQARDAAVSMETPITQQLDDIYM